jgi:cardiolipin synthase
MRLVKFAGQNTVTLLQCGVEFFPALIAAIDGAQTEIYLETYIFGIDDAGIAVMDALIRAANRDVVVNLVTDWLGTGRVKTNLLASALRHTKVNHRPFNPWFRRGVARSHRKICVVDRRIAFVGGININHDLSSDYGINTLPAPRWDFSVSVVGPLVQLIHEEAEAQWLRLGRMTLVERIALFNDLRPPRLVGGDGPALAGFVVCDNLHNRLTIQHAYLHALDSARQSVLMANPYFAPGRTFRDALAAAAGRGVEVTLLLGVGQFSFQDAVARSFYPKLLKSGVKLVEYRKTQLHAKVAVIDEQWATVGSSNCDGLSLFVNLEANVFVQDQEFSKKLRSRIETAIAEGVVVKLQDFIDTPWYKRAWYGMAFLIYRGIMRVITLNNFA